MKDFIRDGDRLLNKFKIPKKRSIDLEIISRKRDFAESL